MALPLVSLLTAPLLARALGADGRGQYANVSMSLFIAVTLATGGVPEAIIYFLTRGRASPRRVLLLATRTLTLTASLAVLALFLSAHLFDAGYSVVRELVVVSAAAVVPSCLVAVGRAAASARHKWHLVNAERYASALVRLVGFGGLFLAGRLTVTTAVGVAVLSLVVPGVVYLNLLGGSSVSGPPAPALRGGDFVRFAGLNGSAVITSVLLARFDQVAAAPLIGTAQLGLYATAAAIAEVPQLITWAAREVMLSHDADLGDAPAVARVGRIALVVTAAFAIVLAPILVWAVPLLFGSDFTDAVEMTWVLMAAVVIAAPGNVLSSVLVARGAPGLRVIALGAAFAVDMGLLVAFASAHGGLGAAWAMCIASGVATFFHVAFFCRLTGLSWTEVVRPRLSDVRALVRRGDGGKDSARSRPSP
jgi:O-antigen/teichoic acid export membrane protein